MSNSLGIRLKNPDGTINHLAFSKDAEKWAEKIHEEGNGRKNKPSQLRKFYDEFFKLYQRSEFYGEEEWKKIILPQLHMLVPKVVYAQGRKLVTEKFVRFMKDLIGGVKSKEDLKIAANFFEAFVGFYKIYDN